MSLRHIFPCHAVLLLLMLFSTVAAGEELLDFDTQVMPVLTSSGCNSGACHGAAAGRGEFRLSLYGSRPAEDFEQITLALEGRRVNRRQPDASLLIRKPSEQLFHGGGLRLDIDSPGYMRLTHWIAQGAQRLRRRTLTEFKVDVSNHSPVIGEAVQLSPKARFSDGELEECLHWTVFTASDEDALLIEGRTITPRRPGRHIVLARFLDQVVPIEILVPLPNAPAPALRTDGKSLDSFVNRRLTLLHLSPAPPATPEALIRRLSLDLNGRLPATQLLKRYRSSWTTQSRQALVDELMQAPEFTAMQTWLMAQVFSVRSIRDEEASRLFYKWIEEQVASERPVTDIARAMVTSKGSPSESPETGWFRVHQDPRKQAEYFSRTLMGVRMQCANCHDHPLDSWKQNDYHGLAAVFVKVRNTNGVIRYADSGEVIHPATKDPAVPSLPSAGRMESDGDLRRQLADWLLSDGSDHLARITVNRIWKQLMGRGLVEPVDDLRSTNPASHPILMSWLVQKLKQNNFGVRPLIREICLSESYARSTSTRGLPNGFAQFYPAAIPKPMTAEIYSDAVQFVIGGDKAGTRTVSWRGLQQESRTLDVLGRCTEEACTSSGISRADLSVQLHLLTGPLVNEQIRAGIGPLAERVRLLRRSGASGVPELIQHYYERALCRQPSSDELKFWTGQFMDKEQYQQVAEDFIWALLTSREFMTSQ